MADASLGSWAPFTVAEVGRLLADVDTLWWLSGGEAIDVHLRRPTRAHGDIDVSVRRSDWPAMRRFLRERLDVKVAHDGALADVADEPLADDIHGFWARDLGGGPWRVQLNLEPVDGGEWVYRRDARIRRPIDQVVWWRGTLPYVNPAVQLLWKAKAPRPQDDLDLDALLPELPDDERRWLVDAVRLSCPASPWAARLDTV